MTWKRHNYLKNKEFDSFLSETFTDKGVATFSREDLFNRAKEDVPKAIFSIIFWGYPRNMRGSAFNSILTSLSDIEKVLSGPRDLDVAAFSAMCKQIKGKVRGVGLSTLSKFLYFFEFRLGGYRCLILDRRIIEVLNAKTFPELTMEKHITESNKVDLYVKYLGMMEMVAKKNNCKVDQLELFLFQFGLNLKPTNA